MQQRLYKGTRSYMAVARNNLELSIPLFALHLGAPRLARPEIVICVSLKFHRKLKKNLKPIFKLRN